MQADHPSTGRTASAEAFFVLWEWMRPFMRPAGSIPPGTVSFTDPEALDYHAGG